MGERFLGVCETWDNCKAFKKHSISKALDGTEDDTLLKQSEISGSKITDGCDSTDRIFWGSLTRKNYKLYCCFV
jgi:hypothetical protein